MDSITEVQDAQHSTLKQAKDELLRRKPEATYTEIVNHLFYVNEDKDLGAVDRIIYGVVGPFKPQRSNDLQPEFSTGLTKKFGQLSLAEGMLNGNHEPEELVEDVLLKGNAHQIFCATGQGKTWVALWLMKELIKQDKTVAYIDMENGPRITVDRLKAFGVCDVSNLLYSYTPSLGMSDEDKSFYCELLDKGKPELIVFDSFVGCLSACGLEENSNTHVEQWANLYVSEAKARGCTVLILDHVPHDAQRSRGATRKKDLVDVQWELRKVEPFDRSTVGYVELVVHKDRETWLPKKVGFSIGGTDQGFLMQRSSGPAFDYQEGDGLTPAARTALASLELFGSTGATYTEWRNNTLFNGKGMNDRTFRKGLERLKSKGNSLIYQDNGRYYRTTEPYRTSTELV